MALNLTQQTELEQNTEKQRLRNVSAYALPNNVAESNLSDDEIKKYFYQPTLLLHDYLCTLRTLMISNDTELNTLISDLDTALSTYKTSNDEAISSLTETVTANKTELDAKDDALQLQITTNATNIASEVTNRKNADTTLQENIDTKLNINGGSAYKLQIAQRDQSLSDSLQPAVVQDITNAINSLKSSYSNDHIVGIALDFDSETYKIKVVGTTESGDTVESNEIDLPSESSIVDIKKTSNNKGLVFTLRNGNSTTVNLGDIVSNFVTQGEITDITSKVEEVNNCLSQESTRQSNEATRIANENTRIANEQARAAKYDGVDFDALANAQEAVENLSIVNNQTSVTYSYKIQVDSNGQPQLVLTND